MFYTYILKSQRKGSYYIGSCKNIECRLYLHNGGLVKSTKRDIPWQMVYAESFDDLKDARRRESQLKSWKKRSAIEALINIQKI